WIEPSADAGVDQYTFHIEATDDVPLICRKIRESGMKTHIGSISAVELVAIFAGVGFATNISLPLTNEPISQQSNRSNVTLTLFEQATSLLHDSHLAENLTLLDYKNTVVKFLSLVVVTHLPRLHVADRILVEVCFLTQNVNFVGIGLKPGTAVSIVEKYVDLADMILIMTVEPGFGGQKFMTDMMGKVKWLRNNYPELDIEVDGGVGPSTIGLCAEAGANMIVSGTAVIGAEDPGKVIATMRDVVENSIQKNQLER
ncbi:unnamed protein product, partial [Timema podura]|nr:unnamed protein product [Timema podura]